MKIIDMFKFRTSAWQTSYITNVSEMEGFFAQFQRQISKGKLYAIWTMGALYLEEDGLIEIDEPIVLVVDGWRLEILAIAESRYKVGVNTLRMSERSYQYPDARWSRQSEKNFSGIVGRSVAGFEIKRKKCKTVYKYYMDPYLPDQEEYISSIDLLFDNGQCLRFNEIYIDASFSMCVHVI